MTEATKEVAGGAVPSEADLALKEVHDAHLLTQDLENEGNRAVQQLGELTEAQSENFRRRAERQRKRGVADLNRRYSGVASRIVNVTLNERAIGSAFQRHFPVIENGIYVIGRRGEMFLGALAAEKIMDRLKEMISEAEAELRVKEAETENALSVVQSASDFIAPEYTSAAATHEVQVRTPMALTAMKIFERYDAVLAKMQALLWNQGIDQQFIEDTELQAKRAVQKLSRFTSSTVRGMLNKGIAAPSTRSKAPAANQEQAVAA